MFGAKIHPTIEPSLLVVWKGSIQNQSKVSLRTFSGMPGGLTEEELDQQFELFLQEVINHGQLFQPAPAGGASAHIQRR